MSKPAFVIFGAYGTLGSTVAKMLCEQQNDVLLVGRQSQKLALMADSLGAHFYCADCTDFSQVSDCIDIAIEHFGRLDGIAHCISSSLSKPAHLTIEREWFQTINTNLTSAFACLKYSVQSMRDNGGSIVLTSSAAASVPMPNHEASSAAKLGIIGLTRSAASTYERYRVKINAVTPGPVESSSTTSKAGETVVSLLTERANWVSGHIFGVDAEDANVSAALQKRQYLF